MVPLSEIFDVWYGVNLEVVNSEVVSLGVPFVSRQSVNNGVVCHVKRVEDIKPNPAHSLSIAVSGSVLSTFYHDYEYYSGRDIYVAQPKRKLSKAEMLYYCYVIEQNKFRYNYGRGANKTFRDILVPNYDEIPNYIRSEKAKPNFKKKSILNKTLSFETSKWQWFEIGSIFNVKPGKFHYPSEYVDGETPYLSATSLNNGLSTKIDLDAEFKGNVITTEKVKCKAFYQPYDFCATSDVNVIMDNGHLNKFVGLFIATVIDFNEKFRWTYGRQCRKEDTKSIRLKLPAINTGLKDKSGAPIYEPDWQFMEDYIKSLPYSACI